MATLLPIQLPVNEPAKTAKYGPRTWALTHMADMNEFVALPLAGPTPNCWGHVGSKLTGGRSLSVSMWPGQIRSLEHYTCFIHD